MGKRTFENMSLEDLHAERMCINDAISERMRILKNEKIISHLETNKYYFDHCPIEDKGQPFRCSSYEVPVFLHSTARRHDEEEDDDYLDEHAEVVDYEQLPSELAFLDNHGVGTMFLEYRRTDDWDSFSGDGEYIAMGEAKIYVCSNRRKQ